MTLAVRTHWDANAKTVAIDSADGDFLVAYACSGQPGGYACDVYTSDQYFTFVDEYQRSDCYISVWYLTNPTIGSKSVTWAGDGNGTHVIALTGANKIQPMRQHSSGDNKTASVAGATGCRAIYGWHSGGNAITAVSGATSIDADGAFRAAWEASGGAGVTDDATATCTAGTAFVALQLAPRGKGSVVFKIG